MIRQDEVPGNRPPNSASSDRGKGASSSEGGSQKAPDPVFSVRYSPKKCSLLSDSLEVMGDRSQIAEDSYSEERELTLGLDFGTSCLKVVISDRAAGKAFAVPFQSGRGINKYILASRVFETEGRFSLIDGEVLHRDLKLSFAGERYDFDAARRVIAFLALAIRRARGWIFKHHAGAYRHVRLFWTVSIGLPASLSFEEKLSNRFRVATIAAWRVANSKGAVTVARIDEVRNQAGFCPPEAGDIETCVVPEIAAQIYGFVVSDSFDRRGRNIFLIVDVGAGTVDASLFHVGRARGGKYNFSFYTTTVKNLGVVNLHRHRCKWWLETFGRQRIGHEVERAVIESSNIADHDLIVPNCFTDYFPEVQIESQASSSPDVEFFNRIRGQVVKETFLGAISENQIPKRQLVDVPFYLCGGGSRMGYYRQLRNRLKDLRRNRSVSASFASLMVPVNLDFTAAASDYDRLSVAYGLAWLKPGWVVKTEPMPSTTIQATGYRHRFIDKDQI